MSWLARLTELGIELPDVVAPLAAYVPAVRTGNLVYTSGQLPMKAGELPHIGYVLKTMQEGGLEALDIENLRFHYAKTLDHWSDNFEAKTDIIKNMIDERRYRIWRVYLAGCVWAFEHDEVSLFQVLCRRAGQSSQALPWSRRWIYT